MSAIQGVIGAIEDINSSSKKFKFNRCHRSRFIKINNILLPSNNGKWGLNQHQVLSSPIWCLRVYLKQLPWEDHGNPEMFKTISRFKMNNLEFNNLVTELLVKSKIRFTQGAVVPRSMFKRIQSTRSSLEQQALLSWQTKRVIMMLTRILIKEMAQELYFTTIIQQPIIWDTCRRCLHKWDHQDRFKLNNILKCRQETNNRIIIALDLREVCLINIMLLSLRKRKLRRRLKTRSESPQMLTLWRKCRGMLIMRWN